MVLSIHIFNFQEENLLCLGRFLDNKILENRYFLFLAKFPQLFCFLQLTKLKIFKLHYVFCPICYFIAIKDKHLNYYFLPPKILLHFIGSEKSLNYFKIKEKNIPFLLFCSNDKYIVNHQLMNRKGGTNKAFSLLKNYNNKKNFWLDPYGRFRC